MTIQRYLLSFLVAVTLTAAQPKTPEAALGAARYLEEAEGNYPAAIEAYKKILAQYGKNRPLAAKALVRMGQCYEKLGDAEARKAYERAVRDFSDQAEAVATARARLAAMAKPAEKEVVTRLVTTFDGSGLYRIALAGERHLTLVREGATFVRDLVTGEERRVLEAPPPGERFDAVISSDGKRLLLTRYVQKRTEIYIVGLDGSNRRRVVSGDEGNPVWGAGVSPDGSLIAYSKMVSRDPYRSDGYVIGSDGTGVRRVLEGEAGWYPQRFSWSGDGRQILVEMWRRDAGNKLLLVSPGGGPARVIPEAEQGRFSPDGKHIAYVRKSYSANLRTGLIVVPAAGGSEAVVANWANAAPIRSLLWTPDGAGLLLAATRPDQQDADDFDDVYFIKYVSGADEMLFKPRIILRSVHHGVGVLTRAGEYYHIGFASRWGALYDVEIDPKTALRVSEPRRINTNSMKFPHIAIGSAWSPDGEYLAYLSENGGVFSKNALVIRAVKHGEERRFYPNGITEDSLYRRPAPRLNWFPDNRSLLLSYGNGELFRFDTRTGEQTRLLPDRRVQVTHAWGHAVALAPDGHTIYYRPDGDRQRLVRSDISGGPEHEVCRVSAGSIGSFVLSPDGNRVAFAVNNVRELRSNGEYLMTVAASGGEPREILRPTKLIRAITWSRDGRRIIWSARTKQGDTEESDLLSVPADGGESQPLGAHNGADFLAVSPDGRHLVFTGATKLNDLWVTRIQWQDAESSR